MLGVSVTDRGIAGRNESPVLEKHAAGLHQVLPSSIIGCHRSSRTHVYRFSSTQSICERQLEGQQCGSQHENSTRNEPPARWPGANATTQAPADLRLSAAMTGRRWLGRSGNREGGQAHLAGGGDRGAQALADEGLAHDSGRHCERL